MSIKVRSVTYAIDINQIVKVDYQKKVVSNINKIKSKFSENNIIVRTLRFSMKLSEIANIDPFSFIQKTKILSDFSKSIDVRWFNISFNITYSSKKDIKRVCALSYEIIKNFENSFVNLIVTDKNNVNIFSTKIISKLILDISKISPNSYDNFRFGVSLNPNKNTPFFPFSFMNNDHTFSIALEVTTFIEKVIKINKDKFLDILKKILINKLSKQVLLIDQIGESLTDQNLIYNGQDISLAPYPDENVSVIKLLQLLGLDDFGSSGTLFFTSYLTSIIKDLISVTNVKIVGFNGVMYSLLEDKLMCSANNKKLITLDSIISYSTVCGCGLDMVPVPGNILNEELSSIILDLATISIRLNKPLGVRILPIQNLLANEFTEFDMDFLTNTRILDVKNLQCSNKLFEQENLEIRLLDN